MKWERGFSRSGVSSWRRRLPEGWQFDSPPPTTRVKACPMKSLRFRFSLLLLLLLSGASSAEDPAALIERVKDDAKTTRVKADCTAISSALMMYKINAGRFPTEKQGLRALVEKPADEPRPVDWVKLMHQVPKDPWGREYSIRYREKEKQTMLYVVSKGPDPEVAEDDIVHPVDPPKAEE